MRGEEIIKLMNRQKSLDDETLYDLQNLLEEYPYFQAAHILYALNLQVIKDSRFNAELRKSACYTGDRRKLFYLVEDKFFSPTIINNLEKEEESENNSSFDLIDIYLNQKEEKEKKKKTGITNSETVPVDYLPYSLSEETPKQGTEIRPMQHQKTIDTFLEKGEKEPIKIELRDSDSEESEVAPNLEAVNQESFFSETLAKIYLKQRKYEKALEIIHKLNLLYPEKNLYFADQIRFLEKLIINK